MMDHFNITVLDGTMVSTKRGLQVSKSNHQGIRFVNSYAAPDDNLDPRRKSSSSSGDDVPRTISTAGLGRQFKFVYRPRRGTTSRSSPDDEEEKPRCIKKETKKRRGPRRPSMKPPAEPDELCYGTPRSSDSTSSSSNSPASIDLLSPDCRAPDVWETYNFGFPMTKRSRKMVHAYFASIPSKMYPLDHLLTHNPVLTPGFYDRINRNIVTLRCVAGTGLFLQTLLKGVRCNDEVFEYMANLYSLINTQLQVQAKVSPATIECICSMAIAATHIGQYDHWRLHMRGLKQIIQMDTDAMNDGGYLMNKLRRADIKGAAIVGELPFLTHHRAYRNVSDVLPQTIRSGLSHTISSTLSQCGIRPSISASITGLAIFAQTIKTASAAKKGTMLFQPNAFIDEWYWVQHQMLCQPGPLCDPSTPAPSLQIGMTQTPPSPRPGSTAQTGIVSIRMPEPKGVRPSHAENLLEPAVRLAGVLYIEALMPDEPRTLNGYAILLALVTKTIEDIMGQVRRRRSTDGGWYPALQVGSDDDGLPTLAVTKPVMIWVALVAYVVAWVGDGELQWDSPRYDRSVYLECLALFVGPSPEDVDLLSDADMVLCEILGVQELLRRDVSNRDLLKEALTERRKGVNVGFGDWESGWVW